MFIKSSQSGYNRHGEQFARGSFLMVFSHNQYTWEEQNNRPHFEEHGKLFKRDGDRWIETTDGDGIACQCAGSAPYTYDSADKVPSYYLKYCPVHSGEYKTMPSELNRKLYACVRHVSLHQMGHWMTGTARIAGQSVTVSGSYGSDGLPMDYEKLIPAARVKLVELPADLTEEFWKGGGHNSAGSEASAMRRWALEAFKGKVAA